MPRAQCYYEILGISETASSDEIKKAYRNLALVWHPDKNQDNPDEAHAKFQTILKAYETLSDNREREWYDRHKDQILSDGDKTEAEATINLFQYFSSACYANFDDSEDGFYTLYRKVFGTLAQEEAQAIQQAARLSKDKKKFQRDTSLEFPSFGKSDSDYDAVVRPFYAHWSGFCTKLTFDHLDKYNTTEAENRRILRAMEKENKKVKDIAKKERNANVRNLVEFIKKRDKRLKAHKLLVEEQNKLNREKTAEKQRQQRTKKVPDEYKPVGWEDLDDIEEQLQLLEEEYDNVGRGKRNRKRQNNLECDTQLHDSDGSDESNVIDEAQLDTHNTDTIRDAELEPTESESQNDEDDYEQEHYFCPACSKEFRSVNAFQNHEASKKHKQKVSKLTKLLEADESKPNK